MSKRFWPIICAVALLSGCAAPKYTVGIDSVLRSEMNLKLVKGKNYRCTVGAHRGDSVKFTENTLDAIKSADASEEFAFIEFDVQYSADGIPVVFHDIRLQRVFGSMRKVGDCTFKELVELTDSGICTYDDAMNAIKRKHVNIEIKSQGDDEEDCRLVDFVIADLRRRRMLKKAAISSISTEVVKYLDEKYPEVPSGKIYWIKSSTYLHMDFLTKSLYKDLDRIDADYLMLHVSNLRNINDLIALKPDGRTIVFWDFQDRMYIVHKDLQDRLWGESLAGRIFDGCRYRMARLFGLR